jgi:outer membrane protein assembly factor BamE (lipoprotein component of BamABCDE complex)
MKGFILAVFLLILTGCAASSGSQFNSSEIEQFKPGITTYQDAVNSIGKPYQVVEKTRDDNSTYKVVQWLYVISYSTGIGIETKTKNLIILFDHNGKMIRIHTKQGLE